MRRAGLTHPLGRSAPGRSRWPSEGRFFIKWQDNGQRLRQAAGDTPSEALEAQKRKRLQLEANHSGFELMDLRNSEERLSLTKAVC